MIKLAWIGGVAGLSLLATAPVSAQIHGGHSSAASAVLQAPPATTAATSAPAPAPTTASKAKARYADCMRRYRDRKGCRYLAWRKLS